MDRQFRQSMGSAGLVFALGLFWTVSGLLTGAGVSPTSILILIVGTGWIVKLCWSCK